MSYKRPLIVFHLGRHSIEDSSLLFSFAGVVALPFYELILIIALSFIDIAVYIHSIKRTTAKLAALCKAINYYSTNLHQYIPPSHR